jgi:hypothetical protein
MVAILAGAHAEVVSPANPVSLHLPHERRRRDTPQGYQTWWATSATSSSLRCWVSSLMRFPPMDTGENPHWVDSASRSLPTCRAASPVPGSDLADHDEDAGGTSPRMAGTPPDPSVSRAPPP